MSVIVIDYWMWNLQSVKNAVEACWFECKISNDDRTIDIADKLILPWVGAFGDGMMNIKQLRLYDLIRKKALQDKIPILGICLWMQLLWTVGYELWVNQWLDLIEWEIQKFIPLHGEKIPHVGWNNVSIQEGHPLFEGIQNNSDFYFVHSYYFSLKNTAYEIWSTDYIWNFPSIINKENIFWVQFHPEKSGKNGHKLLHNFLKI